MLQILIDEDEDLDVQNHEGDTPLMLAAQDGYDIAVRALVAAEANLELKNSDGKTAYDLGTLLSAETRSLLLPASTTVAITGADNGTCSPLTIDIAAGTAVKLKLVASKKKMFLLTVPSLSVSLMAGAGGSADKNIKVDKPGKYPFQCGVHGGSQSNGVITVK